MTFRLSLDSQRHVTDEVPKLIFSYRGKIYSEEVFPRDRIKDTLGAANIPSGSACYIDTKPIVVWVLLKRLQVSYVLVEIVSDMIDYYLDTTRRVTPDLIGRKKIIEVEHYNCKRDDMKFRCARCHCMTIPDRYSGARTSCYRSLEFDAQCRICKWPEPSPAYNPKDMRLDEPLIGHDPQEVAKEVIKDRFPSALHSPPPAPLLKHRPSPDTDMSSAPNIGHSPVP